MMLILFKLIILAALVYSLYLTFFRLRLIFLYRLLALGLACSLALTIVHPPISTKIANFFGIGRGVDFIFYLSHLFIFVLVLRLYARAEKTERVLTDIVRSLAISEAQKNNPPK